MNINNNLIVEKIFLIWSKSSGRYRRLEALLKEINWRIQVISTLGGHNLNEDGVSSGSTIVCLAIFQAISRFSKRDIEEIHKFYSSTDSCNCLLIAHGSSNDNESRRQMSNIDDLVSTFGIKFQSEINIIRPNPYKFYHPKDAQLEDFIANRALDDLLKEGVSKGKTRPEDDSLLLHVPVGDALRPKIIFPKGCSLSVDIKKSTILMTSSPWALPSNQAICALHENKGTTQLGTERANRLIAISSSQIFTDEYIDKEDNRSLVKAILDVLTNRDFSINVSDARTIEIPENNTTPDATRLCDKPIACFQESYPLPDDRKSLIDFRLFTFDNTHLPRVLRAYKELHLAEGEDDLPSSGPLKLIKPKLELPHLSPRNSLHGFIIRRQP